MKRVNIGRRLVPALLVRNMSETLAFYRTLGFEMTGWQGVVVPAKTPTDIVKKLHTEIVKALQSPDVRELLAKQNVTAYAESPAEFTAFIKADRERIARVGRQVGITLD